MNHEYTDEELERDLAFAIEVARFAGDRVLELRESGRWADKMLADIGDQAADGYLQGVIQGRYPDDGILSEETVDTPARLAKRRCWIIDPLDGTKEFCQLRDDWGVHVALTIDNACAIGVVYLPTQKLCIHGVALPGRERIGAVDVGGGVPAFASPDEGAPARVVVSRSHTPPWVEAFAQAVGADELIPFGGCGNKTIQLLTGKADVYVHKKGLKEWDTCAPETLARAAGWQVVKLDGSEHRYNQPDPHNHEYVMCRSGHSKAVLDAIQESGARDEVSQG